MPTLHIQDVHSAGFRVAFFLDPFVLFCFGLGMFLLFGSGFPVLV